MRYNKLIMIVFLQKRDSLTFLGELDGGPGQLGSRRNSKDNDFLSVLTNPVNIRRVSAPPISSRQRSFSSTTVT